MTERRVRIHPAATAEALAAYTQQGEPPDIPKEFRKCLRAAFAVIAQRPETYPLIDHKLRRYLLTPKYPYGVLYEVLGDGTVYITVVMHLKREPGYWKGR